MADVTITIRKNVNGVDSTIMVSGQVDDSALSPFTVQLSSLLSAAVSATDPNASGTSGTTV